MQTPSLDVPESGAPEDTRTPLLAARRAEGGDVDRGSRRSLEPPDLIGVSPAHGEFRGVLILEPYFSIYRRTISRSRGCKRLSQCETDECG